MSTLDTSPAAPMPSTPSTPSQTWSELLAGNARFVAGEPLHPHQDVDLRHRLAALQTPRTALFGCSDSRLAAEIIFDQGLGDLFVVRNAGQVISESVVGSLEYAVGVLGVQLIVVLGHDECGAVRAAIDSQVPGAPALPPHIANLISPIVPAVKRVAAEAAAELGDAAVPADGSVGADAVRSIDAHQVGRYHLQDTIGELLQSSEMISEAIADGRLAVVGANYRLSEGRAEPDVVIGTI